MRISINNLNREPLGQARVDAASRPDRVELPGLQQSVGLHWDHALDDEGRLRRCVVCGCREIFKRYDFPQRLGLGLVVGAVLACVFLLIKDQVLWAMGVLLAAVGIDRVVYVFTGECLVCYRCRSEYRDVVIDETHDAWDLAIGEKYRPIRRSAPAEGATDVRESETTS